jgi:hypothetical protein
MGREEALRAHVRRRHRAGWWRPVRIAGTLRLLLANSSRRTYLVQSCPPHLAQREQRDDLCGVPCQAPVADLRVAELSPGHLERVFGLGCTLPLHSSNTCFAVRRDGWVEHLRNFGRIATSHCSTLAPSQMTTLETDVPQGRHFARVHRRLSLRPTLGQAGDHKR